ncbi:MAG: hypothetical protein A2Z68_02445 [Candidatus Nealsonbacteria bacterium RBG_13_38_11]|uniref:Thioredoxin domain-containing protein n=1 Tax=Candidatus Nealsonbacteria bacterium RBG_13_38_11 TaxID=1801662 RepID=A0A1G2E0J3_9BACT|nr:MAG: hypothetical protein A2Z68_02445 [Candidatus Nealsonbacteria bacterium RBG_13_38_11]
MILTDENFEKEISEAKKPLLIDFWMQGCAPCVLISPILEKLAEEFKEEMLFAKVDLNVAPLATQKYGVNAAPTVILFKNGEPVGGFVGLLPEETIRAWLKENLAKDNEKVEKLIQEYTEYAKKNGFSLNPDKKVVEAIVKSLLEREKTLGARYCPCRRVTENTEENKKIVCPCAYHLEELERDGKCLCGLFVKNVIK